MLKQFEGRELSTPARCLALVLALKMRETFDGKWVLWRGRQSLAQLTGMSTKSVTKARRELLRHHLIFERRGGFEVVAKNGTRFRTPRGVLVVELVRDPVAAERAERESKARMDKEVEDLSHFDRVMIQKVFFDGTIGAEECRVLEMKARAQTRRLLLTQRGNRVPPSNSADTASAPSPSTDQEASGSPSLPSDVPSSDQAGLATGEQGSHK